MASLADKVPVTEASSSAGERQPASGGVPEPVRVTPSRAVSIVVVEVVVLATTTVVVLAHAHWHDHDKHTSKTKFKRGGALPE